MPSEREYRWIKIANETYCKSVAHLLDASSYLYKRVCPSIRRSVNPLCLLKNRISHLFLATVRSCNESIHTRVYTCIENFWMSEIQAISLSVHASVSSARKLLHAVTVRMHRCPSLLSYFIVFTAMPVIDFFLDFWRTDHLSKTTKMTTVKEFKYLWAWFFFTNAVRTKCKLPFYGAKDGRTDGRTMPCPQLKTKWIPSVAVALSQRLRWRVL